ncbi:MAG: hypothetical protein Tsb009_05410 [Planctomycetaceae bacterium]
MAQTVSSSIDVYRHTLFKVTTFRNQIFSGQIKRTFEGWLALFPLSEIHGFIVTEAYAECMSDPQLPIQN